MFRSCALLRSLNLAFFKFFLFDHILEMDLNENVLNGLDSLKNLTYRRLYCDILSRDEEYFRTFFVEMGLLHDHRTCPGSEKKLNCSSEMTLKKGSKGWTWRCKKWNCRKEIAYKSGTFFESSKLAFKEVKFLLETFRSPFLDFRTVVFLVTQPRDT